MVVMTFVNATLRRRHGATVLVKLPMRGGVENAGQGGTEEVMMVAFVVMLERRYELRHGWKGPGGCGRLGAYVKALHEAALFLSVFLTTGT